jgi:hypothetical protein
LKDTSNQKPSTEEGQTKERAKDKGEKDKLIYKTLHRKLKIEQHEAHRQNRD